jgi:hypothetical protein
MCSYDHLDLPTLQQIRELRGGRVHFLVPLGGSLFSSLLPLSILMTTA